MGADRLGEVGDDDRLGVDDGPAERLGLGAPGLGDPHGGQAEGRLGGRDAGELAHRVARVHREVVAGHDAAARDLGAAHAHDVLVRVEPDVVADAHGRDDHAELGGDLAPDRADALQQRAAAPAGRPAARGRSRSPARAGRARARRARRRAARPARRRAGRGPPRRPPPCLALAPCSAPCAASSRRRRTAPPMTRNGIFGSPGTSAKAMITTPATSGALRCSRIWPATSEPRSCSEAERVTRMPVRDRDQQRGDLRAQAVADGQQREVLRRPRRTACPAA